jgi:hypothetical protein
VEVIQQPKASFRSSSSFTDVSLSAPVQDEGIDQLILQNIFLKAEVSRRTCYEGEPVVATFRLYSRLQSSSEAEKSPGFYGFSVLDMIDINAAHLGIETINGAVYNTSTLRQVQLYPVQSGRLVIDELFVSNDLEFADAKDPGSKRHIYRELHTDPITINVKPLPPG